MFYTAVEGVAGAMGHTVRQAEELDAIGHPGLLIADFVSSAVEIPMLAAAFDPLRTAVFAPHEHVNVFRGARENGIAHVYRRGALPVELPKLLNEYSS
jgi:hypothetical protein